MHKPLIAEIHLRVASHSYKGVCSRVVAALRDRRCRDFALRPLYVNSDIEDTELRICVQFSDPDKLGEFVAEKIRKVKGVVAAKVRLTLDGEVFSGGVRVLARMPRESVSCHVFVQSAPGSDKRVYRSLCRLKPEGGVLPVWIFRDFYEYDRDITLRLVGTDQKSLRSYVEKNLGEKSGIQAWRLRFMHSVTQILKENELLKIAGHWFTGAVRKTRDA